MEKTLVWFKDGSKQKEGELIHVASGGKPHSQVYIQEVGKREPAHVFSLGQKGVKWGYR